MSLKSDSPVGLVGGITQGLANSKIGDGGGSEERSVIDRSTASCSRGHDSVYLAKIY